MTTRTAPAATPFDTDAARLDIERRNTLRVENHLPRLNVEAELRRLKEIYIETEFQHYIDAHQRLYSRCLQKAIHKRARAYGNPTWRPHSFQAIEFENAVRALFWRRFEKARAGT